jgi:hypothetical protein
MNEKLKELAHQAGLEFATNSVDMPIIVAVKEGKLADPKAGLEKFAELIIQECADTIQKRYMGDNNREDMEVRRCVEDLKKHFGVEE